MNTSQEKDAILALISTLTVVFVVLFVSLVYFSGFRTELYQREAYVNSQLEELRNTAPLATNGEVAGYETEELTIDTRDLLDEVE
ncbi:MAG: hypothetical protein M3P33_00880 [bacterium]|nr:hypothetical protein [bacterium]